MVVTRSQSSRAEKERKEREEAVAALPHPLDDEINVDDGGEEQVGESGTLTARNKEDQRGKASRPPARLVRLRVATDQ